MTTGKSEKEVHEVETMDRRDFFRRASRLAGALVLAGSLGWLAGCAGGTATTQTQAPAQQFSGNDTETQQTAPAPRQQTEAPGLTGATDCHFYNDGICEKTGRPCTACIAR